MADEEQPSTRTDDPTRETHNSGADETIKENVDDKEPTDTSIISEIPEETTENESALDGKAEGAEHECSISEFLPHPDISGESNSPDASLCADINTQVAECKHLLTQESGLDENVLREIFKVGLDGKDNVDRYLESENPEIRKLCRRIRIEKRLKQSRSGDQNQKIQRMPSATENQRKTSAEKIQELLEDSLRSITNVRVAAIRNENERQKIDKQRREEIDGLISEEAASAQEKFKFIDSKWEIICKLMDPLEIHEETDRQRDDCVALLEQKDVIIENLKSRLKQADQEFYDELAKENDYINILSDRINDQITLMSDCYREELQTLQEVIGSEKNEVLNERVQQWAEMASMKEILESENISKRCDYLRQYEEHIDSVLVEQHELKRAQKMKIGAEINRLTLEENRLKSAVLINAELLNYNVAILQKRQEESRIIKGHQKRVTNKLQEAVRSLRQQERNLMFNLCNERNQLTDELKKVIVSVKTLRERLKTLAVCSDKRYYKLWDYNQEVAENLLKKIMLEDKKFHKDLLLVPWAARRFSFSKETMSSYVRARTSITGGKEMPTKDSIWQKIRAGEMEKLSPLVVESVLENHRYLMDDRLDSLLEPFSKQSNMLITLHHVFETLGVKKKEDVEYMLDTFRRYVVCNQCSDTDNSTNEEGNKEDNEEKTGSIETVTKRFNQQLEAVSRVAESEFRRDSDMTLMLSGQVIFDREDQDDAENQIIQRMGERKVNLICTNPNHRTSIRFCHVARALKEFALKINEERRWEELLQNDDLPRSSSRLLSLKEVENFWGSMPKVFTVDKRLLWKSLLSQIKDYYKILLRKTQLKQENRRLERQNLELRRLLIRYLPPDYARAKTKV